LKNELNPKNYLNIAAEVCLVSPFPDYDCFLHAFMYQRPEKIKSYNTWINGITPEKLHGSPSFKFVRNQLKNILSYNKPLIVGCNLRSDFESFKINHDNYFDLQNFFTEYNRDYTGTQPISLRRMVFKFFNIDIQKSTHNCILDATYSVKIYEEIYLNWRTVSKKFDLDLPPFKYNIFNLP
jgi:hypothetical protein